MSATAHLLAGRVLPQKMVQEEVRVSGIRHGLDVAQVKQLFTSPGVTAESVVLAEGTPPDPGIAAGFRLGGGKLR